MFGTKPAEPPEMKDVIVDRIGVAEADSVNLEIWWVTFAGMPGVHRIRVNAIGMENKHHLVLARQGDQIRLSTRKGKITGFENLSLGC